MRVVPDKRAHVQQIAKQRNRSYDDNKITGNKQSPKKLLIGRHDSSMMSYDKEVNVNAYMLRDNKETHTGGKVSWKPVGTSWVNCRLWITFPPMYPPITFGAHLECNLNI